MMMIDDDYDNYENEMKIETVALQQINRHHQSINQLLSSSLLYLSIYHKASYHHHHPPPLLPDHLVDRRIASSC